ncbi:Phosphatase family protein, RsbX-like [Desulfonema limicola]|uniref:Phosphatase family protein, RsbX-like n=1 Tax=Desulfonema limicola TaxID=45656 RepID=A0A975B381_9BACT|nr:SpoIIE family protein phosphatase [Desulfonema limicola]QTA77956.1 Phosphatase family protein, RsbX-like [Desulfonema limicola]
MPAAITTRAYQNDIYCGDKCAWWEDEKKVTLCIADGLGHGPEAEAAARLAIDYIEAHLSESIPSLFLGCDIALQLTRGAALGLIVIDKINKTLTYAGIGNTRAFVVNHEIERFLSNYGIVGGGFRKLTPETSALPENYTIIMYTDGIEEIFDFNKYTREMKQDIQLLSQEILKDWGRTWDDAAIMIYKP